MIVFELILQEPVGLISPNSFKQSTADDSALYKWLLTHKHVSNYGNSYTGKKDIMGIF